MKVVGNKKGVLKVGRVQVGNYKLSNILYGRIHKKKFTKIYVYGLHALSFKFPFMPLKQRIKHFK